MARILVVEDELVTVQRIWQLLETSEHVVVSSVVSALEAVQAAAETQPDLVLMSVCIKGEMDSITAAAQIYQQFNIPTIYLSTDTEDEIPQPAIAPEPFGYLVKPFNQLELRGAINNALHRSHLQQQLEQVKQLYTDVQRLNADLESQVLERTAQLQRALDFEALLKRITDKVRDSLDENQILQAAVEELGHELGVKYCGAALYSADLTTGTITHEYLSSMLTAQGQSFIIADEFACEVYYQLFRNQYCQFCLAAPNPARPHEEDHAILACPLLDDQGVLGDLWLFKPKDESFNTIEIRLVQQVANQCAIALRQSRLYQAAQTQVTQLERLNQLKDDFLSTISHELRTPISNIKMAIQMLEIVLQPLGVLDTELGSANRYFQILQNECQREIGLIDDLLNLSRLNTETEPLVLSTVDLQAWISHAVEPSLNRIYSQQQQLELDLPSGLPPLVTDLSCLGRILSELLDNACKYTPAGEIIRVAARVVEVGKGIETAELRLESATPSQFQVLNSQFPTSLQISVTNTGVEIPAEELPHIFDRFYRVPSRDPWRHSGIGLGLALAKKLVDHLGASIHVTSAVGQTTFIVTLPIADEGEGVGSGE